MTPMNSDNIKILICAHKECKLPKHPYFQPIQVGAAMAKKHFLPISDDTGDNISNKNPHFCELTAHYWAWKNMKCDIIGLNHYRRYFNFKRRWASFSPDRSFCRTEEFFSKDYEFPDLTSLLAKYDMVLVPTRHYPYDVGTQYKVFHLVNDLNQLRDTVKEVSPEYLSAFDDLMNNHNAYSGYNMFITSWKHFDAYSEWMFKVLFRIEEKIPLSPYPDQARIFGYMSERLINAYCIRHKLRIKNVPVIMPIDEPFSNPSNALYTIRRLKNDFIYKMTKW